MKLAFLGLSITSSWGNGHAVTYRGLCKALAARGHEVVFLERDVPWYAENRDLPDPPYARTVLYRSLEELRRRHAGDVLAADLVVLGSFVPEGAQVGEWITRSARGATAFYDIDTPVTLRKLAAGDEEYLTAALVPRFDVYLSFTGGPVLGRLEREHGARRARPLYCAVDPEVHAPAPAEARWDLGYLGTFDAGRQGALDELLLEPARRWREGRFAVAGPLYPPSMAWPANVDRIVHLSPPEHRAFYGAQRFTLNATRADMRRAGWSPSVRLFEAAACGVPVVSDAWPGLDEFFRPGEEILVARTAEEALAVVRELPEAERRAVAERARARVLAAHTAAHRARQLEGYLAKEEPCPGCS